MTEREREEPRTSLSTIFHFYLNEFRTAYLFLSRYYNEKTWSNHKKKEDFFFLFFFTSLLGLLLLCSSITNGRRVPMGWKHKVGRARAHSLAQREEMAKAHSSSCFWDRFYIYIHLLLRVLYVRIGWHIRHSQRKWEGEAKVELTRKRAVRTRSIGAESSSSSKPKALSAKWHLFLGTDNICHAGPISEEHLRSRKPNIFPPIFLKRKRGGKKTHLLGLLGSRPVRP